MAERKMIQIASPTVGEEDLEAMREVLASRWLTQGPQVRKFEEAFAAFHGAHHGVAASSCTAALHLALEALGVGPGDEVVVPAFTWIATANAVEYVGARPVFCDVDRETYNLDVRLLAGLLTSKTRAVVPVHLFGLCADMEAVAALCRPRGISIIEDAACAAGASRDGKMAGTMGDVGCFSFHPRKIITTGDGGMCLTGEKDLFEEISRLRNHGASLSEEERHRGPKPYLLPEFEVRGFNYRLTDLQGALGLSQLSRLPVLIEERRSRAAWYDDRLADIPWLGTPEDASHGGHVYQSYVCSIDEEKAPARRNEIMEQLWSLGISTRPGTHAVPLQRYYADRYGFQPDDFPAARDCERQTVTLPLHHHMSAGDYVYIVDSLRGLG